MDRQDILVALYARIEGPASAICKLSQAGFDVGRISVLGPLSRSNERSWASLHEGWHEGQPSSTSTTASVMTLGPLASILTARGYEGAETRSLGPVESGLSIGRVGIPGISPGGAILYEQALRCGKFVLVLLLCPAEAVRAKISIGATTPMRLDVYLASPETAAIAA